MIFMKPDYGLWFLWVLFIIYLTFSIIGTFLKRFKITTPFACFPSILLLYIVSRFITNDFGVGLAFSHSIYYYVGMILRDEKGLAHKLFGGNRVVFLCLIAFLLLVPFWYRMTTAIPEDVNNLTRSISNRFSYRVIVALLGSMSVMGLCRMYHDKIENKCFQFIGRNTLGIYVTHQTIIWLIMHFLPESWIRMFHGTIVTLLLTIIILLLSIGVMTIIKSNRLTSLLFMGDCSIFYSKNHTI